MVHEQAVSSNKTFICRHTFFFLGWRYRKTSYIRKVNKRHSGGVECKICQIQIVINVLNVFCFMVSHKTIVSFLTKSNWQYRFKRLVRRVWQLLPGCSVAKLKVITSLADKEYTINILLLLLFCFFVSSSFFGLKIRGSYKRYLFLQIQIHWIWG